MARSTRRPRAPRKGKRKAAKAARATPSEKKAAAQRPEATAAPEEPVVEPGERSELVEVPAIAPLNPFSVVGVGASAGGLEAFSQLLGALPKDLGMAIVLVQHLAPQHESALPVLLAGVSPLPVVKVSEGMRVEANHVYVIPPNVQMEIAGGELHLNPRPSDRSQYTPVDFFLRSLADSLQDRAIAVILSGTASDGAGGVRDVKSAGGITFAQQPESARYDGMPRAAIATGMVDQVLAPREIAAQLVQIARHPYAADDSESVADERRAIGEDELSRVFALVRAATGVDFKHYKTPTIVRRLQRRMALQKLTHIKQYLKFLQETPAEVLRLYQDVLIHVTRFFREPESFEALRTVVFPQILANHRAEAPLRIWVCGCATGEEAYSVAIALLEYLGDDARSVPIQIFATDVSESAIEHARVGSYGEGIAADVSPGRLRSYFTKVDGNYRVSKLVRDLCVFARQDLTRDPPFSKLDLILCRNVLIYMNATLQRKLMSVFHYALKPGGFLMLGHAETIGTHSDLFAVSDKRHRIYAKKLSHGSTAANFPVGYAAMPQMQTRKGSTPPAHEDGRTLQNEANRVILDRYAPSGVVVDSELEIVQFRGQTGRYLEPAPGDPSLSILKMAREGLLYGLRTSLHSARKRNEAVRREGLRVRANGGWHDVNLEVIPLDAGEHSHYLVVFEEEKPHARGKRGASKPPPRQKQAVAVTELQQELAASRDHLQSIIQELEAANEELQSANEEILSSNEELQSTNEELDTAKEELQSTNEELNTVNEELHGRNEELSRVNSDLINVLTSVEIAIVIVASDLRIRRFTPMAERVLNLIPADIGRPISQIKPNIDCPDLEQLIHEVVDRVMPRERQVLDRQGNAFLMRIRPYKNVDNRIEGAVLTLFDVEATKRQADVVRSARELAYSMVEAVREPVVLIDQDGRIHAANLAFCETFGLEPGELEGCVLFDLSGGAFDVDAFRSHITQQFRSNQHRSEIRVEVRRAGHGSMGLHVNGRRFETVGGQPLMLLALRGDAREREGR